jgi:hypothetical protein
MICNFILFSFTHDNMIKNELIMLHNCSCCFYVPYASSFINVYCNDEGMSFMTFVRRSLYPRGNNAP